MAREGQCKPVSGRRAVAWLGKRRAQRGLWEKLWPRGSGEEEDEQTGCLRGRQREVLANKATWEGGQASESSIFHPLKMFPETYRPECKSWCASNSSWNLSSVLYARMVQRPWREDDRWENTGLRAGEAEKDKWQIKPVRLDARKPTASRALWWQVPPNSTPRASQQAALGRRDSSSLPKSTLCVSPQPPVHTMLHFNDLYIKASLWTFDQIQSITRFRFLYELIPQDLPQTWPPSISCLDIPPGRNYCSLIFESVAFLNLILC